MCSVYVPIICAAPLGLAGFAAVRTVDITFSYDHDEASESAVRRQHAGGITAQTVRAHLWVQANSSAELKPGWSSDTETSAIVTGGRHPQTWEGREGVADNEMENI